MVRVFDVGGDPSPLGWSWPRAARATGVVIDVVALAKLFDYT